MDKTTQKRSPWKRKEVVEMLAIIKDSHILKLLSKTKRNKAIFEDIAKELSAKGIYKNAFQNRAKFKALKQEYYKAKRRNNTSGASRQFCPFFDELDEILASRPAVAAVEWETSEKFAEDLKEVNCIDIVKDEPTSENDENYSKPYFEISNASSRSACKTFKAQKKQTYRKVLENFTEEWKQTQSNLIKVLEKQEKKYIAKIDQLMEKNRNEIRIMMEEERRETAKMYTNLLSSLQTPLQHAMPGWCRQRFPNVDDNDSITSSSGVERGSAFLSTLQTSPKEERKPFEFLKIT